MTVPDKHGRDKLQQWKFRSGDGTEYKVRDDRFGQQYPDGGSQGPHFNYGLTDDPKLKGHAYYDN